MEKTKGFRNIKNSIGSMFGKIWQSVKTNFIFATLNFLFIVGFINLFSWIFGAENSIIAVIMSILMGICAGRYVVSAPIKNFLIQTLVFSGMAVAACFSVALGAWIAIPINLVVIFIILYAYTYEYSPHLYFPYILSYLFMLFISPVQVSHLPTRLLSVVVCSACMILYAMILGYRNVRKPVAKSLCKMFEAASLDAECLASGLPVSTDEARITDMTRKLSALVDKFRRSKFDLPKFAIPILDVGKSMEKLLLFLHDDVWKSGVYSPELWCETASVLRSFSLFITKKISCPQDVNESLFATDEHTQKLYTLLNFCGQKLLEQSQRKREKRENPMPVVTSAKIKSVLGFSTVRLAYAIRVSILLTAFIIPVQFLHLKYGKWLIFTLASVSLPYAEDVKPKSLKRLAATVIGGAMLVVCFSLITNATARTALLMLSGYLSFYFAGYVGNYACATFGALGGAAVAAFGWADISVAFGIRLFYIFSGIMISYVFNVLFFPYKRKRASEMIFKKYDALSRMLASDWKNEKNSQMYYGLDIDHDMLEQKLFDNVSGDGVKNLQEITVKYRKNILRAHSTLNSTKKRAVSDPSVQEKAS